MLYSFSGIFLSMQWRKKCFVYLLEKIKRKQYQKRHAIANDTVSGNDIGELIVRLTISTYCSAKTPSFHVLCDKNEE